MAGEQTASALVVKSLTASTGDVTGPEMRNDQFRGGDFIVEQTAQGSTLAFVTVKIQGRIAASSTTWYTVGTIDPATTAVFRKRLRIYPGASTANDSTALQPSPAPYTLNEFLPPIWRFTSTNSGTVSVTWSLTANLYA